MDFSRSAIANGNISPARAIKHDVSRDFRVLQATVGSVAEGDPCIGISHYAERRDPSNSDGYAAIAGENLKYWGDGARDVPAQIGGPVTRGDRLKPGANGKLIVVAANKDNIVAIAKQSGIDGDVIDVDVVIDIYNV